MLALTAVGLMPRPARTDESMDSPLISSPTIPSATNPRPFAANALLLPLFVDTFYYVSKQYCSTHLLPILSTYSFYLHNIYKIEDQSILHLDATSLICSV